MRPPAVLAHTGVSTPVAATRCGSAAKALRTAAMASGWSRVSASTVSTTSSVISGRAVFMARALPPPASLSQWIWGWLVSMAPSGGGFSP